MAMLLVMFSTIPTPHPLYLKVQLIGWSWIRPSIIPTKTNKLTKIDHNLLPKVITGEMYDTKVEVEKEKFNETCDCGF